MKDLSVLRRALALAEWKDVAVGEAVLRFINSLDADCRAGASYSSPGVQASHRELEGVVADIDAKQKAYERPIAYTDSQGVAWEFREEMLVSRDPTHPSGFKQAEVLATHIPSGQSTRLFPSIDWNTPDSLLDMVARARAQLAKKPTN